MHKLIELIPRPRRLSASCASHSERKTATISHHRHDCYTRRIGTLQWTAAGVTLDYYRRKTVWCVTAATILRTEAGGERFSNKPKTVIRVILAHAVSLDVVANFLRFPLRS